MKNSQSSKFLFTNYHVINKDFIKDNIEIEIWNKEKLNLNLSQQYINIINILKNEKMLK